MFIVEINYKTCRTLHYFLSVTGEVYHSVNIDVTIKDFYTVKHHTLCFIMFAIIHDDDHINY